VLLAQSQGARGDIEDAAALVLHFATGALGAIQIAWTREGLPGKYSVDVLGSDSVLHLELDPAFDLTGQSRGQDVEAQSKQHPVERGVRRFLDSARKGDKTGVFCTPDDAAGTLAVAVACEEALISGGTVAVPTY
jgi:predicted dehydrogenase